jgi:hypothetical protein
VRPGRIQHRLFVDASAGHTATHGESEQNDATPKDQMIHDGFPCGLMEARKCPIVTMPSGIPGVGHELRLKAILFVDERVILIELGFLPGTPGPNRFGQPPTD